MPIACGKYIDDNFIMPIACDVYCDEYIDVSFIVSYSLMLCI